jgi:hypothetical protein
MNIPPSHLAVLQAMTQPDPQPPEKLDSPAFAICRRLPDLTPSQAMDILQNLNALGFTDVPYIEGMLSPAATADLTKWITEKGWEALGFPRSLPTKGKGRPS